MASQKVPAYAQAVIDKCELCGRGVDARYFCEDCQEEMCKQCKSIHLRSKSGRTHTVISTAMEVDEEKQVFCTSHPKKEVHMYCNDCEILVCLTCIASKEHQSHALDEPADAMDKCRKEFSKRIAEEKQEVSTLEGKLKTVFNNKKEYETGCDNTIDSINNRREKLQLELKSQVDRAADALIDNVKKHKNQDVKDFEKQADDFTRIISDKRARIESCEEMLQTGRGFSVFHLAADFKEKLNLGPSTNLTPQIPVPPRFVSVNPVDIQSSFGDLEFGGKGNEQATAGSDGHDNQSEKMSSENTDQSVGTSTTIDTAVVADIKPGIASYCISTVNSQEAWVANGWGIGSSMAMIDINGQIKNKKTMDFKIWDIAVTSEGDVLLTEYEGYGIKKYKQDGQCVDVTETSPFYPSGICTTSHNDKLVGLYDSSGGTRVVRMTTNGQVKQTIKQDQHNQDLFTEPRLIAETFNGDVCVVDSYNPSTVIVVSKEGILRFRYPDKDKSVNTLQRCDGIACDKLGFILLSDCLNQQIQLIDKNGSFVQYVLTKQHGITFPTGLSIDNRGKLWMCNESGKKVRVVKYRS